MERSVGLLLFSLGFDLASGFQLRMVANWGMNLFAKKFSFELFRFHSGLWASAQSGDHLVYNIFGKKFSFGLFWLAFGAFNLQPLF